MFQGLFRRAKPVLDPDRDWAENRADRWVLALWAPYIEAVLPAVDSDPIWFEKLDAGYPPDMAASCRQTLVDDWDINDRDDVLREVRALIDFGHRQEYDGHRAFMAENGLLDKSPAALRAVATFRVENEPDIVPDDRDASIEYLASAYHFITQAEPHVGAGGIAAWDFMRVGNVLALALAGGWIEPRSCWGLLYEAGRAAQSRLNSWAHLGESFALGRRWWGQASPESEDKFERIVALLLSHPDSPWAKLDWQIELDPAKHPDLRAEAATGNREAQYRLGQKFKQCCGRDPDPGQAFRWTAKAARQGHARAQNELGAMYQAGTGTRENREKAAKWYRAAADQGQRTKPLSRY